MYLPIELLNQILSYVPMNPCARLIQDELYEWQRSYEDYCDDHRLEYYEDDPLNYRYPEQIPFHRFKLRKLSF